MRSIRCLLLVVLALIVMAAPARSNPIAYDEAGSGDLTGLDPLTTFTLDIGTNTVTGSLSISLLGYTDFDSFAFVIPGGMQVTNVSLSTGGDGVSEWRLYEGSSTFATGTFFQSLLLNAGDSATLDAGWLPLGADIYNFSAALRSGIPPSVFSYVFSLDVAVTEVPEPATLSLLGLALAGLGARGWRQQRESSQRSIG